MREMIESMIEWGLTNEQIGGAMGIDPNCVADLRQSEVEVGK